jgi:hypothetical protein
MDLSTAATPEKKTEMRDLTAMEVAKVARQKKPWKRVSYNLYLKDGTSWVYRYKRKVGEGRIGLGPYHTVTLQEAREKAREQTKLLLAGQDPKTVKRAAINATRIEPAKTITFRQAALDFLATDKVEQFKSEVHRKQWRSTLEKAFKDIGDLPLQSIDSALVLRVLLPIHEEDSRDWLTLAWSHRACLCMGGSTPIFHRNESSYPRCAARCPAQEGEGEPS